MTKRPMLGLELTLVMAGEKRAEYKQLLTQDINPAEYLKEQKKTFSCDFVLLL